MENILSSVFFFIVTIGVLVTVHEFGHFWVARRLGVKVLRFSIGFGRPLWSWRRAEDTTEYVVAALPLGGYVQMLDEREGPVAARDLGRAFNRQPLAHRCAIVAAGPLCNFLLAVLAYWVIFVAGIEGVKPVVGAVEPGSMAEAGGFAAGDVIKSIGGKPTPTWNSVFLTLLDRSLDRRSVAIEVEDAARDLRRRSLDFGRAAGTIDQDNLMSSIGLRAYRPKVPAVIGRLEPGGAAERAGMMVGDRIITVNGREIEDWEAWVVEVREHPGERLEVEVERRGGIQAVVLRPERISTAEGDIGRIGAAVELTEDLTAGLRAVERYGVFAALGVALVRTWDMSALTVRMLARMVAGEVSVTNLGGPIRIAQYAGYSASVGAVQFIGFIALISISLGVLNLLPVPVLDGGHLMYFLIEGIKGSPLSEQSQLLGQRIGVALLIGVMLLAFYNDLVQMLG